MSTIPNMSEVMTPFPYAIALDRYVGEAQRMMVGHEVRHLPVTADGEVFSVITERDIQAALLAPDADPWQLTVRDVCVDDPYIADVSDPLDVVLEQMALRHIGCAILAQEDRVAGIYTTVDACRQFAETLRKGGP